MSYLKSAPVPSWLPKPRTGSKFKITLWLDPATYLMLMRKSADLEAGRISIHKWLRKQLELEDAAAQVQKINGRTGSAIARHINAASRPQAIAARRRRQPRKVAA